ncbi:MAG: glutamate mutase L [Deltaproteobacteria bacterium]|nr:glutamate mutase L [Deltaproteobacteria bacterium]
MKTDPTALRTVLVTDCGSTTTKALLFRKTAEGWRQTHRGEAPTTVEQPVADVTVGALNAFTEVEEVSGRRILAPDAAPGGDAPLLESGEDGAEGVDLYLSTSSAGGGLQMTVAGVVRHMSAESAERAALSAGAIVMDAISADDGREDHERIQRLRHLRPDIVLLTGGVDGGSQEHVVEMAETLVAAAPRPRFGDSLRLPVIYAGNTQATEDVRRILEKTAQVAVVDNVRPTLDAENLSPARETIHEFFLAHVMSHSPGYDKLLKWTPVPVMPTPAAVGDMVRGYAEATGRTLLCADIGGATTDVFSVFDNRQGEPVFNRTVSANLGMSYSVANVLIEAGVESIRRWLPYAMEPTEIRDRLRNKMIRPTSIPQTLEDLWLEQAVCREALRLALVHHRSLAVGLSGVQQQRGIADIFSQTASRSDLVDMMALDLAIGSGGVLSHAPDRMSAALMILEGFELQGFTQIAVDSIFMMPHLGVFASVHPDAAREIFLHDCLVNVAHAVVPVFPRKRPAGSVLAEVFIDGELVETIDAGNVDRLKLEPDAATHITVRPTGRNIDVGAGPGATLEREFTAGLNGVILDGRNRPLQPPASVEQRIAERHAVMAALGLVEP